MLHPIFLFFFFNDTATTEIYTLSLHYALPISRGSSSIRAGSQGVGSTEFQFCRSRIKPFQKRSEEHTSELQSRLHLVCRLLLEKKKKNLIQCHTHIKNHDNR